MTKKSYLESKWYAAMQRASYISLTTMQGTGTPAIVFENELKESRLKVTAITSERKLLKICPGTWERSPDEVEVTRNLANAIVRTWLVAKKRPLDTSMASVGEDAAWNKQNQCQQVELA